VERQVLARPDRVVAELVRELRDRAIPAGVGRPVREPKARALGSRRPPAARSRGGERTGEYAQAPSRQRPEERGGARISRATPGRVGGVRPRRRLRRCDARRSRRWKRFARARARRAASGGRKDRSTRSEQGSYAAAITVEWKSGCRRTAPGSSEGSPGSLPQPLDVPASPPAASRAAGTSSSSLPPAALQRPPAVSGRANAATPRRARRSARHNPRRRPPSPSDEILRREQAQRLAHGGSADTDLGGELVRRCPGEPR
jgi:hypothetical protein